MQCSPIQITVSVGVYDAVQECNVEPAIIHQVMSDMLSS